MGFEPIKKIVLTGGPGSGKTSACRQLAAQSNGRVLAVPEAATQVYTALGRRWDQIDTDCRRQMQRRIYQLQIEHEAAALERAQRTGASLLLLDRGTVDGAAYWPDGSADYWRVLGTALDPEFARYDAAIWLQTAAVLGIYDGQTSNPIRHEDGAAAIANGQRVRDLWCGHARFCAVDAFPTFDQKLDAIAKRLPR